MAKPACDHLMGLLPKESRVAAGAARSRFACTARQKEEKERMNIIEVNDRELEILTSALDVYESVMLDYPEGDSNVEEGKETRALLNKIRARVRTRHDFIKAVFEWLRRQRFGAG